MDQAGGTQSVFNSYADAHHQMDGKALVKLFKDTHIIDNKYTTTDIDILFAKYKDKASKKLNHDQFLQLLQDTATKKGVSFDQIKQQVASSSGPQFQGTKADYVKFHDDKSTFTGVHQHGGPDTGSMKVGDLSNLCDRSGADVRGVKK